MSYPLPGVYVNPNGTTQSVTITDDKGNTPTVYSDPLGQNVVALPKSISSPFTFYLPNPGSWTVAGVTLSLEGSEVATVTLSVLGTPPFNHVIDAVGLFEADNTGATDAGPAINKAIAAAAASTNTRTVWLRPGTYLINTPIVIGNGTASADSTVTGVQLWGSSPPGGFMFPLASRMGATRLIAGTALTGSMITIQGPLFGWGLKNLYLDNSVNQTPTLVGVKVVSAQHGEVEDVTTEKFMTGVLETTVGPWFGTSITPNCHKTADEVPNTSYNKWRRVSVYVHGGTDGGSITNTGVLLTAAPGESTSNTCYEDWSDLDIFIDEGSGSTQHGLVLAGCDNNRFRNVLLYQFQGGGMPSLVFDYTVFNAWPCDNVIENVDFQGSLPGNVGSPGVTQPNRVINMSQTNGFQAAAPAIPNLLWIPHSFTPTLVTPAVPASGTTQANNTSCTAMVYLTGGTASATIAVNGTTIATLPASGVLAVKLQVNDTIAWTGTAAPTWTWMYGG